MPEMPACFGGAVACVLADDVVGDNGALLACDVGLTIARPATSPASWPIAEPVVPLDASSRRLEVACAAAVVVVDDDVEFDDIGPDDVEDRCAGFLATGGGVCLLLDKVARLRIE